MDNIPSLTQRCAAIELLVPCVQVVPESVQPAAQL